jgi:uncharacterized YigZ family protein
MFTDTYKTLATNSKGVYTEKGSRFIGLAFPVENEEEVKRHLADIRKSFYDARHHCFAYILGAEKIAYRINDDGEPSGTAGKPIYGQLLSNDLTNVLIVVVRYFGGIKLGVPGLINAYRTAAKEAIDANTVIEKTIDETYRVLFDFQEMNAVMKVLKNDFIKINSQTYIEKYVITFTVRRKEADKFLLSLRKISDVKIEFIK